MNGRPQHYRAADYLADTLITDHQQNRSNHATQEHNWDSDNYHSKTATRRLVSHCKEVVA